MSRLLALTLAVVATVAMPCAGQTRAAVAVPDDVSTKQPTPHSNSAAGASSGEDSAAEAELLAAANKNRELAGVPPLRMDEGLREAAQAHAKLMVSRGLLEHQLSGESSLLDRIALVSPLKMDRVGENIAYANGAPDANEALMHSPPHRENLLDREFDVAGIAAVWSKGRLYVVQDFAHEVPAYSPQQKAKLIGRAIGETRQQAGLPELAQLAPANLDQAACTLSNGNRQDAHLLATAYDTTEELLRTRRAVPKYCRKLP
jgi:uncharacterized protein YkwD